MITIRWIDLALLKHQNTIHKKQIIFNAENSKHQSIQTPTYVSLEFSFFCV